jgi:hypothetical protein
MSKKSAISRPALLAAFLLLLQAAPVARAELYKWVDAQGKTHYADTMDAAGQAPVKALKPVALPTPPAGNGKSIPAWKIQEKEFKLRQEKMAKAKAKADAKAKAPARSTYIRDNRPETDASRCKLARAVLSGAVRHGNGARTDSHDRQVAKRDITKYCH